MKEHDDPRICITQAEYDELQECRRIVEHLWSRYGPYEFPKDLSEPFEGRGDPPHRFPRSVCTRIRDLERFDDSE